GAKFGIEPFHLLIGFRWDFLAQNLRFRLQVTSSRTSERLVGRDLCRNHKDLHPPFIVTFDPPEVRENVLLTLLDVRLQGLFCQEYRGEPRRKDVSDLRYRVHRSL